MFQRILAVKMNNNVVLVDNVHKLQYVYCQHQ